MFSYSWCWINNTKVLRARLRKNLFGSTSRTLLLYCSNHSLYIFKREGCSKLWQSHHLQPSFLYNHDQVNLSFVRSLFLLMINFQKNKEVGKVSYYIYFIPPFQPIVKHNTVNAMKKSIFYTNIISENSSLGWDVVNRLTG